MPDVKSEHIVCPGGLPAFIAFPASPAGDKVPVMVLHQSVTFMEEHHDGNFVTCRTRRKGDKSRQATRTNNVFRLHVRHDYLLNSIRVSHVRTAGSVLSKTQPSRPLLRM